jgi:hypothetical protein
MIRLSEYPRQSRMRLRQHDVIADTSAPGGLIEPDAIPTSKESSATLQDITVRVSWLTRLFVGMGKTMAVVANLKASKTPLRGRVSVMPDPTHTRPMIKKNDRVTIEERRRWLQRREESLAGIETDPARVEPSDVHADVAVLEEWLDGHVSNESLEAYMRDYEDCERCQAVYRRYKSLKSTSLLHHR